MGETILRTLIGSRAHGLATAASDWDYRYVYVTPRLDLARAELGQGVGRDEQWTKREGEDVVGYEVGHFLKLALRSNPSVLEVLVGPAAEATERGRELRGLFPHLWSSADVRRAFGGYAHNQTRKYVDDLTGPRGGQVRGRDAPDAGDGGGPAPDWEDGARGAGGTGSRPCGACGRAGRRPARWWPYC